MKKYADISLLSNHITLTCNLVRSRNILSSDISHYVESSDGYMFLNGLVYEMFGIEDIKTMFLSSTSSFVKENMFIPSPS